MFKNILKGVLPIVTRLATKKNKEGNRKVHATAITNTTTSAGVLYWAAELFGQIPVGAPIGAYIFPTILALAGAVGLILNHRE